jgi:hypothetical protein
MVAERVTMKAISRKIFYPLGPLAEVDMPYVSLWKYVYTTPMLCCCVTTLKIESSVLNIVRTRLDSTDKTGSHISVEILDDIYPKKQNYA